MNLMLRVQLKVHKILSIFVYQKYVFLNIAYYFQICILLIFGIFKIFSFLQSQSYHVYSVTFLGLIYYIPYVSEKLDVIFLVCERL